MLPEIGLFFLLIALLAALLQASYLMPAVRLWVASCLPAAAWLQALCIALAFATLIALRIDSDFTVTNVVQHSNRALPLLYKIVGSWGNHEGSMLLWVLVLTGFGAMLAMQRIQPLAVAVQAAIGAGFLLFILFTSNPFTRIFPPPADGDALNPILQDVALSIHPPLLYLGYVGFSIVFSLAVATMLSNRVDRNWAEMAHPWILAAWSALTCGIGLGSWWAYRVLGWGGFWFWDPVENASLLPWLSGTALLHSNLVLKKRGALASWVLLLSIITFGMSLLGTFLVRSGMLVSVHSFASDPTRGLVILGYITLLLGSALLLFAVKAGTIESGEPVAPISREGFIIINNLFLLTACATVLLGTVYPMLAEIFTDTRLSVGAPYFNLTCLPLLALPLFLAGLTPFVSWRIADMKAAIRQARPVLMATLAVVMLILAAVKIERILAAAGIGLAVWLAVASLRWLKHGGRRSWPVFFAHLGAAALVAGVTGATLWKQENEAWLAVGEWMDIGSYRLVYENAFATDNENYQAKHAEFLVNDKRGNTIATLAPEYRLYHIRKTAVSPPAVHYSPTRDIYIVLGEASPDSKRIAVRAYLNPMMSLIWAGFVLMAMGGITGIIGKRRGNITI